PAAQQPPAEQQPTGQGGAEEADSDQPKIIQSALIPGRSQELGSHPSQRGKEDEDLPEMDELPDVL
ncbi:MAG: hypothetical protein HUJ26_07845, partial [Planctomycetaceae bacterium]|nr:hypothetical protein [Planctomycetaceae bacterium]